MRTGLFLALLDSHNPRGHPILAALLYLYCPAAARWWIAGADPVPPFDPVWQALVDRASGKTLGAMLQQYGLESFGEDLRKFIARADAYRRQHPGVAAPEMSTTFIGFILDKDKAFGNFEAIQHLGGRWENLLRYAHAWAFLIPDWKHAMRFAEMPQIQLIRLAVTAEKIRRPIFFPTWSWTLQHSSHRRITLGLPVQREPHSPSQLQAALLAQGQPPGEKPWSLEPELWLLSRSNGAGRSFRGYFSESFSLGDLILGLSEMAKNGPYPPILALENPQRCQVCGFQSQCWVGATKDGSNPGHLSQLALSHLAGAW
jgi:hypothetical protein